MNVTQNSNENRYGKIILILSLALLILLIIASFSGIFFAETYARNTKYYAAQGIGQDIVNLFVVAPLFLISTFLYYKEDRKAMFLWAGLLTYIIYTYIIYCFAQPFNFLFLVYCVILGISFYTFLYFILTISTEPIKDWFTSDVPIKTINIYFIIIAVLFYYVWLSELIPALINNEIPQSIIDNGVITNPVHVLDLTILLPAAIMTAIFLRKNNSYGYLFAPILLIFFILMASAIIGMVIAMVILGVETDMALTVIFIVVIAISLLISMKLFKSIKNQ